MLLIDDEYNRSDVNIETIPNNDHNVLRCKKSRLSGIKIFAHINPNQTYSFFKIKIRSNTFVSNPLVI